MKALALVLIALGITFAITVSIGPYVVSLSHTAGGETRISHAVAVGPVQKGRSTCLMGCAADSKTEDFETVDMSSPDLIALSATRSAGQFTVDAGVHKSLSALSGNFAVDFSATKSFHGKDGVRVLRLPVIRSLVPKSLDRILRDNELPNSVVPNPAIAEKSVFPSGSNFPALNHSYRESIFPITKIPDTTIRPRINSSIQLSELLKKDITH